MADAWDYGPGNVDDFSFSGFLSSFTTAAQQSAAAINSVRGAVASVQAPLVTANTRTDAAVPAKTGIPWYVWAIGAVVLYKVAK